MHNKKFRKAYKLAYDSYCAGDLYLESHLRVCHANGIPENVAIEALKLFLTDL